VDAIASVAWRVNRKNTKHRRAAALHDFGARV